MGRFALQILGEVLKPIPNFQLSFLRPVKPESLNPRMLNTYIKPQASKHSYPIPKSFGILLKSTRNLVPKPLHLKRLWKHNSHTILKPPLEFHYNKAETPFLRARRHHLKTNLAKPGLGGAHYAEHLAVYSKP